MAVYFRHANPAAPSNFDRNVTFQGDPVQHDISAYVDLLDTWIDVENAQVGAVYTLLTGDFRKLVSLNHGSAVALTLPQAIGPNFPAKYYCLLLNLGVGVVTITPTTSTIDGQASITLSQYEGCILISNGVDWRSIRGKAASGGTLTWVTEEQVAGTADGVNPTFTVINVPATGTFRLFTASGLRLRDGVGFTRSGLTITMQAGYIPANSGEKPYADYAY